MSVEPGDRTDVQQLRADNAQLQRRVQRLRGRLRAAEPADDQRELGYLFVVTYGRSGSTLVAGLLNSLPGYLIRGENNDALHHLFRFHRTLITEKERRPGSTARTSPFFGIAGVPPARTLAATRRLVLDSVLRPGPDTRVSGFKEIRWYHDDLEDYVAWLREVFPGARFLVNTRDHAQVLASKWWAQGDPEHNATHLAEVERRIVTLADNLGDAAYRIHYDDYVADPTTLRELFDWLGEPWDEQRVRATMAIRHSA